MSISLHSFVFNPIALRKAKIVCLAYNLDLSECAYNFGLSECNRVYGLSEYHFGCLVLMFIIFIIVHVIKHDLKISDLEGGQE